MFGTNNCSYIQVSQEWELDSFKLHQSDEDIHTAIERRLKVKD
jgi:argininosuccinate lyase